MAQAPKIPRIVTGDADLDDVFERFAAGIEAALNITSDPASGLELHRGKGGTFLRVNQREAIVAKTDGSGMTARSGATMGSGTVSLYAFDNGGVLTNLALNETAYTFSATAIPANKYCLVMRANGLFIVVSVEC